MDGIGIVGAGVAGLHLGMLLRRKGVPVTLYSERAPQQLGSGRLPNAVAHHHVTLSRERALGVEHWDAGEFGYGVHHHYLGGPSPVRFIGRFSAPSRAVDQRMVLPRLVHDFCDAGGTVEHRRIAPAEVEELARRHDLVVVATGRGGLSELFPRRADLSPFDWPQRRLCVGLYDGIAPAEPRGVTLSIAPGHGELPASGTSSPHPSAPAPTWPATAWADLVASASGPGVAVRRAGGWCRRRARPRPAAG